MGSEKLLWSEDATALAEAVRGGAVTPLELVEAAIGRAERTNPKINAVAERLYESARETARSIDASLPFAGVPIAIKDIAISVRGVPIHSGSRMPPFVADCDSTIVARYRAAGFIPVVTSTTPEFGLRLVTESERFGITRNPWNTAHVTGGSSGGAAALVAAGIVPVAHASDGGGSIRVPAACTGLVGMKPSRGRVPLTPDMSEGWFGLLVQHALTRSVRDSARMLDLSAVEDPRSPYLAPPPKGSFEQAASRRRKGMRMAVFRRSPLGLDVSAETIAALDAAAAAVRDAGHAVEEIDLPMIGRDFLADFARLVASAHAGEIRRQAVRIGRSPMRELERTTRVLARLGELLSAGEMAAGQSRLHEASRALLAQTEAYDAVLMPIIAHPPLACGAMDATGADLLSEQVLDRLHLTPLLRVRPLFDKLIDQSLWFTHWPAIQNVTGQPAIALPVHVTDSGLPLGVQAVGRIGDEETLFSLAGELEKTIGWRDRRAPLDVPD